MKRIGEFFEGLWYMFLLNRVPRKPSKEAEEILQKIAERRRAMEDMELDEVLRKIAEGPEFLQKNTDEIRAIVKGALQRAALAQCDSLDTTTDLRCQLPVGHDGTCQRLITWARMTRP